MNADLIDFVERNKDGINMIYHYKKIKFTKKFDLNVSLK